MRPDPALDEIREIRRRISEEFDNDPRRVVEYYRSQQKKHADQLWRGRGSQQETTPGAPSEQPSE